MAVVERVARRDQMLEVAARLFSERGYHGTSMQDLGEALGILRGSLYAHISSKEELLFEIVDRAADQFLQRAREVVEGGGPPQQQLSSLIAAHAATVAGNLSSATVFLNEWRHLSAARRRRVLQKRRQYEGLIRQVLDEGVRTGVFRDGLDPKTAAVLVLSSVNWLYQWFDPTGPLTADEVAERFTDMIMRGIEEETRT